MNDTLTAQLHETAKAMVARGKGILAADESFASVEKKFQKYSIPSTDDTRREYRELFIDASGMEQFISGVIMFDETFRQASKAGKSFVSILQAQGVLPGIKVDTGVMDMPSSPKEKITKGLDTLEMRLKEYVILGAKFAKWRAVITIEGSELPTEANIRQNAKDLAAYAKICQEAGLVPIVEPEVLMDADNSSERCSEVSEKVLVAVFDELKNAGVDLGGMILKTNMIVPGKASSEAMNTGKVAEMTSAEFKKLLPSGLAGQAFLSGGQSEKDATANLDAINKKGPFVCPVTFSYGRALQDSALKVWNGKTENLRDARGVFLHRAKMNSMACVGEYDASLDV